MLRVLGKILGLAILVVAGSFAIVYYQNHNSANEEIAELRQDKVQLQKFIQHLTDERRLAQVLVTDQHPVNGVMQTTLIFKELASDGSALPYKSFTIEGNEAHIDAMVITFDHDFVEKNDPLRGHSIALFTRLYGSHQTPAEGFPIDEPGKVPDFYRENDPRVTTFQAQLWGDFWKLADDPDYRKQQGVRIVNGQGVWGPFEQGKIYTISIEADGGINIISEPIEGIYRDALRRKAHFDAPPVDRCTILRILNR